MGWLDPFTLMLGAAGLLIGCIALTHAGHEAGLGHRRQFPAAHRQAERDRRGGFTLVLHDRYLLLIAISVFILNLINTTGDFILAEMVNRQAHIVAATVEARRQFIGAFYGDFQTWVTALTAIAQIFLVARLFKKIGIAHSLLVVPVIAIAGYGGTVVLPGLALLATLKVLENSADYSLQNTVQQALFLPTSRDAKYKAKAAIDTMGVRLGDLASTGLVFLGVQAGLALGHYALANFIAGALWLLVVFRLQRRHRQLTGSPEPSTTGARRVLAPEALAGREV